MMVVLEKLLVQNPYILWMWHVVAWITNASFNNKKLFKKITEKKD